MMHRFCSLSDVALKVAIAKSERDICVITTVNISASAVNISVITVYNMVEIIISLQFQ